MSQLSIGIDIRKSDLRRDVASVRQILKGLDKDITSAPSKRGKNEVMAAKRANAEIVRDAKQSANAQVQAARKLEQTKAQGIKRLAALDAQTSRKQVRNAQLLFNADIKRTRQQTKDLDRSTRAMRKNRLISEGVGRQRAGKVMGVLGGTASALGGLAAGAAGLVGLGAAAIVGTSVSQQLITQKQAADLAVQARTAGDPRSLKEIQGSVMDQASGLLQTDSVPKEKSIAALRAFQAISGDLSGAQKMLKRLAVYADGSSTDLEDMGKAAGLFSQTLQNGGLKGKALEDGLDEVIRSGIGMGASGSVEFGDVAKTASKVSVAAGRAGGSPVQALIDAMAIQQLGVIGGAASAEDAATAGVSFTSDIIKHQKDLQAPTSQGGLGLQIKDAQGNLKPLKDLMLSIATATKGDTGKLMKFFGREGIKSIEWVARAQRRDPTLTGPAAEAAARFTANAPTEEELTKNAEFVRGQEGAHMEATFTQIQDQLGNDLAPAIKDIAVSFREAAPMIRDVSKQFAGLIGWFLSNPWSGLGAVVGTAFAWEIAKANLPGIISKGLSALLTPGAGAATTAAATAAGGAGVFTASAATAGTFAAGSLAAISAAGVAAGAGLALAANEAIKLNHALGDASLIDTLSGKADADANAEAIRRARGRQYDEEYKKPFDPAKPFTDTTAGGQSLVQSPGGAVSSAGLDKFSAAIDKAAAALGTLTKSTGGRDGQPMTERWSDYYK